MMTITPPRSESSPDISPCATPGASDSAVSAAAAGQALLSSSPSSKEHQVKKSSISLPSPDHLNNHSSSFEVGFRGSANSAGASSAGAAGNQSDVIFNASNVKSGGAKTIGFELSSVQGSSSLSVAPSSGHLSNSAGSAGSLSTSLGSFHGSTGSDYSLMHGRSIVSFGGNSKGPSPPQETVVFSNSHHDVNQHPSVIPRRNTIPTSSAAVHSIISAAADNLSYHSAAVASNSDGGADKENLDSDYGGFHSNHMMNGGFTGFDNQFSNNQGWSRAFHPSSGRTSAPLNQSSAGSAIGQKAMYGHRNTMPSMQSSPFAAFENGGFSGFNQPSANNVHASASNHSAGTNVTSLDCYLVQFTSGRTDTYYVPQESPASRTKISAGDYVIVEADRGEDLGRVIMDNINVPMPRRNSSTSVASAAMSSFDSTGLLRLPADLDDFAIPANSNMPKKIYRIAQPVEVESLLGKVRDELNAIAVGHYKVQEWKLPMAIIDAEYQWDRRKLTFFFSVTLPSYYPNQPSPRIDFRTLVRDLYQIYRTRIWMYCVDKDKNRSNRAHNRENFLKQLNSDIEKFPKQHQSSQQHLGKRPNSLKAVLEEQPQLSVGWNVLDKAHNETIVIEKEIDLEQLTFGVADLNVNR